MIIAGGAALLLLALEIGISLTEAAFFSIPSIVLNRLKHEAVTRKKRIEILDRLIARPKQLLGTILVFDTIVSVTLSSIVAMFAILLAQRYALPEGLLMTICGLLLAVILLVFGETIPKTLAVRQPLRIALALAPFVLLLDRLLAPVSQLLEHSLGGLFARFRETPFPTREELRTMIDIARQRETITPQEGEILWNLAELESRTVSEIMTPRIDIKALEASMTVADGLEYARQTARSRFPVYEATIDQVVGIFYVKDCFRVNDYSARLSEVCRRAYSVPEEKSVPALLDEFRRLGIHIAVVVDQFGQTAGIVTLEDILEAIFGEIRDELDGSETPPYQLLSDGSWLVEGDIDLKTLARLFDKTFRDPQFERLSGLIHHLLGRLPETGDRLSYRGLELEIQQKTGNQIQRVIIRRKRTGRRE